MSGRRRAPPRLPCFVAPMLAQPAAPFDAPEFLFEVKWDGTRALAFIEGGRSRLVSRQRQDRTDRYPELASLAGWPPGTVLDGEIVVLRDGQPDFRLVQAREQTRSPLRVRLGAQVHPVTYLVFDLLYAAHRPLLTCPLAERRDRLQTLVRAQGMPGVVLSEGVVGAGRALFQEVCRRGLEGVVAKRLTSRYQPGRRTEAWRKIKPAHTAVCAILGFVPGSDRGIRSLLVAEDIGGGLRYAGQVERGLDTGLRA